MMFPFESVKSTTAVILVFMLVSCNVVYADKPRLFGDNPDPNELADFLFSEPNQDDDARSWVQSESKSVTNVAALKILFEFDSTAIQPNSLELISRLAQALIAPQAGSKPILIEGHTDAVGDETYNINLSKQRAQAIKDYLTDIYSIDPNRLYVDGLGESELFNSDFPKAAINRRVQIKQLPSQTK